MSEQGDIRRRVLFARDFADLDVRTSGCLWRNGYTSKRMVAKTTDEELLKMRNFGPLSLARLRELVPYDRRIE